MLLWAQNLAAKFLYKTGASVMISCDVRGTITQQKNRGIMYGCNINGRVYLSNGREFDVPRGKFKIRNS